MATQTRPYQGYPYVNPHVVDAPGPSASGPSASGMAAGPSRPATLELAGNAGVSLAELEMRRNYGGQRNVTHQRYLEQSSPFVEQTIFYDPFENRQISQPKSPDEISNEDNASVATPEPATGDIPDPETSPSGSEYYTKQTSVYTTLNSPTPSGFQMGSVRSPQETLPAVIPMENFPEPPPAYTEIDQSGPVPAGNSGPAVASPTCAVSMTYPVITTQPTTSPQPTSTAPGLQVPGSHTSRKLITCQHCGAHVLTVVRKESSYMTHAIAVFLMCFGLVPCAVCVYCTDYFKANSHYCPNCNLLVGKEQLTSAGIAYVTK